MTTASGPPRAASTAQVRVAVARSAAALPAAGWDRLAGDNVLLSRGWLAALEEGDGGEVEPQHILVERDGQLIGAAPGGIWRQQAGPAAGDALLLGRLQPAAARLGLSFLPAVRYGSRRGFGAPPLLGDSAAVIAAMRERAQQDRLPAHVPRLVDVAGEDLPATLAAGGFHLTAADPVALLELPFRTFGDYVESLRAISHTMPHTARKELKQPARHGIKIVELDDAAPHAARLHALADAHNRRLNGSAVGFTPALLPAIKARLGERCVLYGAFGGGELLGFSLGVRDCQSLNLIFVGIDERITRTCTYIAMNYYRVIADALAAGIPRIWFGNLMLGLKRRRGCRIVPTRFAYRASDPLRHALLAPWFTLHRAWGRKRFAIEAGAGSAR